MCTHTHKYMNTNIIPIYTHIIHVHPSYMNTNTYTQIIPIKRKSNC